MTRSGDAAGILRYAPGVEPRVEPTVIPYEDVQRCLITLEQSLRDKPGAQSGILMESPVSSALGALRSMPRLMKDPQAEIEHIASYIADPAVAKLVAMSAPRAIAMVMTGKMWTLHASSSEDLDEMVVKNVDPREAAGGVKANAVIAADIWGRCYEIRELPKSGSSGIVKDVEAVGHLRSLIPLAQIVRDLIPHLTDPPGDLRAAEALVDRLISRSGANMLRREALRERLQHEQ